MDRRQGLVTGSLGHGTGGISPYSGREHLLINQLCSPKAPDYSIPRARAAGCWPTRPSLYGRGRRNPGISAARRPQPVARTTGLRRPTGGSWYSTIAGIPTTPPAGANASAMDWRIGSSDALVPFLCRRARRRPPTSAKERLDLRTTGRLVRQHGHQLAGTTSQWHGFGELRSGRSCRLMRLDRRGYSAPQRVRFPELAV